MEPDARKQLILDVAFKIASGKGGIKKATRSAIAEKAGVSNGLVTIYFGGKDTLRAAIVDYAVKQKHVGIVSEAMALGINVDAPRSMLRMAKAGVVHRA